MRRVENHAISRISKPGGGQLTLAVLRALPVAVLQREIGSRLCQYLGFVLTQKVVAVDSQCCGEGQPPV